ncbi:hypothetical protein K0M31_003386 [Melipona bicolor]|uniref:Uncharacterized protein n=1 Tax=Melipona bicolor TaxID=60889 RepID=A0AA40FYV0_9HYME|nr:hypothetical protein K0M31_003386 [Melipona bicolor]
MGVKPFRLCNFQVSLRTQTLELNLVRVFRGRCKRAEKSHFEGRGDAVFLAERREDFHEGDHPLLSS